MTNLDAGAQLIDLATSGGFVVHEVRQPTRADRRREANAEHILWTFEDRPDVWTPAQLQAVVLFYARGMTQAEAARRIGVSRRAFRDRLDAAERHAALASMAESGHARGTRYTRRRPKKGRPANAIPAS